jgi:transketolase
VKTLRKSQPLIKGEVEKLIERYDSNTEKLMIKKSEVDKQIRTMSEQNALSKKQIQQAFDDLRSKIGQQEKELLSKCDQNLSDNLAELERNSKSIVKKIEELKGYSATMVEATRKDEVYLALLRYCS